jgi:SAM-dependent methyltransferase
VPFADLLEKRYWRCGTCQLIYLDPAHYLAAAEEKAQYLLHENEIDDEGYRTFLNRLAEPLLQRLRPGASGLDYGCGPGPALAAMCREAGHEMQVYDPFFAPEKSVLTQAYDFITCTEVVEHLHEPAKVFTLLDKCLKPGGWLGVMTSFYTEEIDFQKWHYPTDPTHVVFYNEETFSWLGEKMNWRRSFPAKNVVLFKKQ